MGSLGNAVFCKMTISPELITDFVVGKNLVEADV